MPDFSLTIAPRREFAVQIGRHKIGRAERVYIIAEAGVNHDGQLSRAKELLLAAKACGADAVKFQIFSADRLASKDAPPCEYQKQNGIAGASQHEMLRRLELRPEDFAELRSLATQVGIDFLATPFGIPDLQVLEALAPPAIKIASPDIVNIPMLVAAACTNLPLIVSTGAATLEEVEQAVRIIRRHRHEQRLALLHCVSAYPTNPKDARLGCIRALAERFETPTGFSDHTDNPAMSTLAVAAGAAVLEKHLTLSRNAAGPDHFFSLEPEQFKQYVALAHEARQAMGDAIVKPSPEEIEVRKLARGSLISARRIARGRVIEPEDLEVRRPADGIPVDRWADLIGRVAATDIPADVRLDWFMVVPDKSTDVSR